MLTLEQREELKKIQFELRQPFPAGVHELRDLPGGARKWVFLRWQTIRERLDDVYPDWLIDYSEIQYLNNDAVCRCGITIMGIRKEALASVPISVLSSGGKEMTRGSAADRLAAEGMKNASELWGVGRYLDNQPFTIELMWHGMGAFPDAIKGEIRKLAKEYRLDVENGEKLMPAKKTTPVQAEPKQQTRLQTGASLQVPGNGFNARIATIRTTLDIDREVVIKWLKGVGSALNEPSQLNKSQCDNLVKYLCLSWANSRYKNSYHANNSYEKRVLGAINEGKSEIDAIKEWMQYADSLVQEKVEAPANA